MSYGQVLVVDNGGFFPDVDTQRDYAWFLMDAMRLLNTEAVGVSEKELKFGASFLTVNAKRSKLDLVCANLFTTPAKKTLVAPYVIKKVGNARVGIFGVMSDKVDLGPSRDSLYVEEPVGVAKRTVAEMRRKGANIVVGLSQLGKVESEDLATTVEGIDVLVAGHNVPLIDKGRTIKNTVVCYGGEQGQNIGRTIVTLDSKGGMATSEHQSFVLLPTVGENSEVARVVKQFEDAFNERMRREEKERAAQRQARQDSPDRYLGSEVCIRCHGEQGEQWKTTKHARAFQALVDAKKDATPECVPCHVVGFHKAGGYTTAFETPNLKNVQCENCHGVGTQHEAFSKRPTGITEQTCVQCHQGENDPEWNFEKKLPMVVH